MIRCSCSRSARSSVVKAILGVELSEIGIAIGNIKRFIEAGFAIDVNRMAGIQIEDSAAIKGAL